MEVLRYLFHTGLYITSKLFRVTMIAESPCNEFRTKWYMMIKINVFVLQFSNSLLTDLSHSLISCKIQNARVKTRIIATTKKNMPKTLNGYHLYVELLPDIQVRWGKVCRMIRTKYGQHLLIVNTCYSSKSTQ